MEETTAYKLYNFKQPWSHTSNAEARKTTVSVLSCPSTPTADRIAPTDYAPIRRIRNAVMTTWENSTALKSKRTRTMNNDMGGVLMDDKNRRIGSISDGLSKTLLLSNRPECPISMSMGNRRERKEHRPIMG